MDLLDDMTRTLAPLGLNLVGTTPVADYDALVPAEYRVAHCFPRTRTVVVIGNGGRQFWHGFRDSAAARPDSLRNREHPLDDYTVERIEAALCPRLDRAGAWYRLVYPFQFFRGLRVSFRHLAEAAGLAGPSILGIHLHPTYGPWLALRAALFTDRTLSAPAPARGFDPCATCVERPCVTACPARAVTPDAGSDVAACMDHRFHDPSGCADRCHARYACVYGREHRYADDELAFHQRASLTTARAHFEKPANDLEGDQ